MPPLAEKSSGWISSKSGALSSAVTITVATMTSGKTNALISNVRKPPGALSGNPVPPVTGTGAIVSMNSHRLSFARGFGDALPDPDCPAG